LCGLNYYTQVFIFDTPNHRCSEVVLDSFQETTGALWDDMLPWIPRIKGYPSKCLMIDTKNKNLNFLNHSTEYFSNLQYQHDDPDKFTAIRRNVISFVEDGPQKSCESGWTYDHSLVFNTITSENDWVCDEDFKPMLIHTVFWVGNTIGCFLWGITNDFFGRKPTVIMAHLTYFIGGLATIFVQDYHFLLFMRFLVGCAHHTVSHLPFLIVVEYCGVSSRTVPLMMVMVSYTFASLTVPWLAMALSSWRSLAIISTTAIVPVLALYRYIPESVSWLVVKGRIDDAVKQLKFVAKINNKEFKEEEVTKSLLKQQESNSNKQEKVSVIKLFQTPNLRINAVLVNIICMMGFMCYYGHVQNTSNLGEGNVYKSYFLGALVELPCWSVPIIISKLGRRWPCLIFFATSGIAGVVYGFISPEWPLTLLSVGLTGRMMVSGAYYICLQYGSEIFPTVIRGQGVALCEIVGGIAIFISPLVVYLAKVSSILPLLILGLCSIVGALATFFLPETAGRKLPQTLEDGSQFGLEQSRWECFCGKRTPASTVQDVKITEEDV